MTEAVKDKIKAFVIENFLFGDTDYLLEDNASLIEGDIIDSTGVLELVAFIEDQFGITMSDSDIVPSNLDSLTAIAAFIGKKAPATVSA